MAIVSSGEALPALSTLSYRGGFEAKTCVYETLVRRDDRGRIAPGLASAWSYADGGRTLRLELREGARFHDGSPVDARAVRLHLRRWVGLPEHDWLLASRVIRSVEEDGPRALVLRLDPPCDVLPDLCAIHPTGVRAPATIDREGAFTAPVGSGPWAWDSVREDGRVIRVVRWNERENRRMAARTIDLVRYAVPDSRALVDDLVAGRVDAVIDGWYVKIPRDLLPGLERDPALRVDEGPGSSLLYVSFRLDRGPCADRALRRAIAAAVDRNELVERVESGHADACATWAPPGCDGWPEATVPAPEPRTPAAAAPVKILVRSDGDDQRALAQLLAQQLGRAGIAAELVEAHGPAYTDAVQGGHFDLRIESTWGMPYDPDLSLRSRFLPPLPYPSASTSPEHGREDGLSRLVEELAHATEPSDQRRLRASIQARIDSESIVVPLYVPRRIAAVRRDVGLVTLDRDLYRCDIARLRTRASRSPRRRPGGKSAAQEIARVRIGRSRPHGRGRELGGVRAAHGVG